MNSFNVPFLKKGTRSGIRSFWNSFLPNTEYIIYTYYTYTCISERKMSTVNYTIVGYSNWIWMGGSEKKILLLHHLIQTSAPLILYLHNTCKNIIIFISGLLMCKPIPKVKKKYIYYYQFIYKNC